MDRFDLHTHTHFSDGKLSPTELVIKAKEIGLKGISITDHDSIEGYFEAEKAAEKNNLTLISGVEIQGMGTEILGYGFDPKDNYLEMFLEKQRIQRKKFIKKKIEGLLEYGIEIDYNEVLENSGKGQNPNSANIAQVMVEKRHVKSLDEAFSEYLREIRVRLETPPTRTKKVIQIIKDAQGIPVLPHPWYLKDFQKAEIESFILKLVSEGLLGIETNGYIPEDLIKYKNTVFMDKIKELTKKYELIETAGSDFHGDLVHENNVLGKYTVSKKTILQLSSKA
ncbi:PHP domain-containing protein [archaeon]|nr:PHP domain-containing protein [archaeon]NCP79021.1 PHP domain-containing protein [archaeon]NCP97596.1 PHP domain-containing protein [archaeon]NCQ06788.1 PHP domain-containing protein [archaeon]NCQ50584.1 PHP domain-containing protein [archaeon]